MMCKRCGFQFFSEQLTNGHCKYCTRNNKTDLEQKNREARRKKSFKER